MVCVATLFLTLAIPVGVLAGAVPCIATTDSMHARYYSPNLGRFISVDPVGGTIGSSQSWNRYSYVRNNPITRFDPDGLTDIYISIVREVESGKSTIGTFSVRGTDISGRTLELPDLGNREWVSRILAGEYRGERGKGKHIGEAIWIRDVPGRTNIAIHSGNETSVPGTELRSYSAQGPRPLGFRSISSILVEVDFLEDDLVFMTHAPFPTAEDDH